MAFFVVVAIVVWLVYRKRLFGVAGGVAAIGHERIDPAVLLAPPPPSRSAVTRG